MTVTDNLPSTRQTQPDTIKAFFNSPAVMAKVAEVLPTKITPERLMTVVLMQISQTPALGRCSRDSLLRCVLQGASLGLSFGANLGQAYMVPYGTEATFIVGYRGLVTLARRSGEIASLKAVAVFEGDQFQWVEGSDAKIIHIPNLTAPRTADKLVAVYMIAKLKDGGESIDVMTRPEVDAIRAKSKAGRNGPWVDHYVEMAKKTVVRRGAKYLPLSPEDKLAEGIEADNEFDLRKTVDSIVQDRLAQANALQGKLDGNASEAPPDDHQPEAEELPQGEPEPEATNGTTGTAGEPQASAKTANPETADAREHLVITSSEAWGVDQAQAFDTLQKASQKRYRKDLEALDAADLADLRSAVAKKNVKP